MRAPQPLSLRVLSIAHVAVSVILSPGNLFLSVFSIPLMLPLQIWLVVLGVRLWGTRYPSIKALRRTHYALLPLAIILVIFGIGALQGAKRSAEAGGGLLGAFGLIPIGMGLATGLLSTSTLLALFFLRRAKAPVVAEK